MCCTNWTRCDMPSDDDCHSVPLGSIRNRQIASWLLPEKSPEGRPMGFRTQRDVDRLALPAGKADAYFFDNSCQGLSVRIQGAKRTRVVHYAVDGRRRRIGLGDVTALPLRDAQKQAGAIVSAGKDGADPLAKREERAGRRAETFGGLVDLYIARYAETHQRPRTLVETRRALKVHLAPLHDLPVNGLVRRIVAGRLLELATTSGPIMANRTRAALSHCFAWAMEQGLAETNPVVGTARPAPEVRRDRTLSAAELRAVWLACSDDVHARIAKLLILTGQRCHEIGGIAWSEIDREKMLFTLPAARSKNQPASARCSIDRCGSGSDRRAE